MIVVLVASSLLVISTQAASITDDQETCRAAAEQVGVDFENFRYNVGHVLHSLTVEDVRFFFDENFPVENNIPTVNTNLTAGSPVLSYAPSFPSKFKFPLGSTLDKILLNNDDPNNSFAKGLTSLEELGHAAHMLEMLFRASQIYKTIENIDINTVCPCLVDEESNGIIEELEYLAEIMGNTAEDLGDRVVYGDSCISGKENQVTSRKGRQKVEMRPKLDYDLKGYGLRIRDGCTTIIFSLKCRRKQRTIKACPNVPELTDSYSWNVFKHDIAGPMEDDGTQMAKNVAIYLHCKIAMLT